MKITSVNNKKIKDVVKLRNRKSRRDTGLTVVDGVREIFRAKAAGVEIKELFVCSEFLIDQGAKDLLKNIKKSNIAVIEVTKNVCDKISFGDRNEGMLAVCMPKYIDIHDLRLGKESIVLVVEGVEKPGNIGAILRTCDGAGVDALMVCNNAVDIYNPNCIRASLGTVFSVPVIQGSNEEVLEFLNKKSIRVVATSPYAKKKYLRANLRSAIAVVVGSEQKGLSDFWLNNADESVYIPMLGNADSLNVSVSAAVLIYEALRQRGK